MSRFAIPAPAPDFGEVSNLVDISTPGARRAALIETLERRRAYWAARLERRPCWPFLLEKVAEIDRRLVPAKLAECLDPRHASQRK